MYVRRFFLCLQQRSQLRLSLSLTSDAGTRPALAYVAFKDRLQIIVLGHCHASGTKFRPQPPVAFAEVFLQIGQPLLLPVIEPCLCFDHALKRAVLYLALGRPAGSPAPGAAAPAHRCAA